MSGVAQTFMVDFFLLSMYAAPNPPSTGLVCSNTSYCDPLGVSDIKHFWQPRLEFINSATNFATLTDEPYSFAPDPPFDLTDTLGANYALPDGWVWILTDQRYSGTFSTELNMNAFPMDIQHLEMVGARDETVGRARGQLCQAQRSAHALIDFSLCVVVPVSFSNPAGPSPWFVWCTRPPRRTTSKE